MIQDIGGSGLSDHGGDGHGHEDAGGSGLVIMVAMVMVKRIMLDMLVMIKVTSTLSTLTPQGSVPSSRTVCISRAIDSRSDKMSPKVFVPNTFLTENCSFSMPYSM